MFVPSQKVYGLWLVLLVFFSWQAIGQVTRIEANYQEVTPEKALSELSQKYRFRFFYDTTWLRELRLTARLRDDPEQALAKLFAATPVEPLRLQGLSFVLLPRTLGLAESRSITLEGVVREGNSGEPIPNARIEIPARALRVITDAEGYYRVSVPVGTYLIRVQGENVSPTEEVKQLGEDMRWDVELFDAFVALDDVVITGKSADENVSNASPGLLWLPLESVRKLPSPFGELDINRVILSLPGAQTVGEGATGFNIRGGSIDQNLVLMDQAPLYNSTHLLGFVSVFNPDLVQDFSMYKGQMPASYGGRLSSVVAVGLRDPDLQKLKVTAGIGPLTNKLSAQLPLLKGRWAIALGGRYSNPTWLMQTVKDPSVRNSAANFYDLNLKSKLILGDHTFRLSLYRSDDFYNLSGQSLFDYQSNVASMAWSTSLGGRWLSDVTLYHSAYAAAQQENPTFREFSYQNGIQTSGIKSQLTFLQSDRMEYVGGLELQQTRYDLGKIAPNSDSSAVQSRDLGGRQAWQAAVFGEARWQVGERWQVIAGVRLSAFALREEGWLRFAEDAPRSELSVQDTLNSGDYQNLYQNLEPRLAVTYRLQENASLKASYTRMAQYEHLFSNAPAALPTDLWLPSSNNLRPALADQLSLGYFLNLNQNRWELSWELYYKNFRHLNLLQTGAAVIANPLLEADIVSGQGQSWGSEWLIKKTSGKITGWLGYAYLKTRLQTNGIFANEQINDGQRFDADFDRPHNLNLSLTWQLSRLWTLSGNFVYNSGRPVTVPRSSYVIGGVRIFNAEARNNFRTPDNHRLDLSLTYEGSNRRDRRLMSSFSFSLYNVYSRQNSFSVVTRAINNTSPRTFNLYVLGSVIPSFTYLLKFE
ncbi:MAG: TonB-dependent receptor domain-containing protein [Bernardetiaceae bacterium]